MPNFFKKLIKEVSRPMQYASRAGSSEVHETGRVVCGGAVSSVNTISKINNTTVIQANPQSFINHLTSMGLSSEAIETFRPLTWVSIGARDKKEFTHKINETTLHKTAVAVRRINENQLIVSIVCYESKVTVTPPKTIIHKVKRNFGVGWRNSDNITEAIDRGLTAAELQTIMITLENQSNAYDAKGLALTNV